MNKKFKRILAFTLLSTCGISKISQNSYAATKIQNARHDKTVNNNLLEEINWKKLGISSVITFTSILALLGAYKGISYLSSPKLDDLPKKELPKIVDLQKNYESKRNLSQTDKKYVNWLKNLPAEIITKVSGEMRDCWEYLLDNFENEIDLNIYVGFHDRTANWDLNHKGINKACFFDIDNSAGSRKGIFEHAMKLKNGLPFEKSDAMGFFKKEEIDYHISPIINYLTSQNNKIETMNIFCPWRKYGESKTAEDLSQYVQATFNEYKKELNKVNLSNSNKFQIGVEYSQQDVNSFLSNLQQKIDHYVVQEMINMCSDELLQNIGGDDFQLIMDVACKKIRYCEESYIKNFQKIKNFLENKVIKNKKYTVLGNQSKALKRVQKTLEHAYPYFFKSKNRPEHWKIPVGTRMGSKNEKIVELIVRTCQALIQTHTFRDGNTRTNTCWLLNKLLIDNGFLPVVLENPKIFYACDIDMLIDGVKKGQQNFKKLCDDKKIQIPDGIKYL